MNNERVRLRAIIIREGEINIFGDWTIGEVRASVAALLEYVDRRVINGVQLPAEDGDEKSNHA